MLVWENIYTHLVTRSARSEVFFSVKIKKTCRIKKCTVGKKRVFPCLGRRKTEILLYNATKKSNKMGYS